MKRLRKNLIGKAFGRLLVIEVLPTPKGMSTRYRAACKCGGTWEGVGSELTRPNSRTTSCGCYNIEVLQSRADDLTNQVFGRLTVLEPAGQNEHGHNQWLCRCECETLKVITGANLKSGNTQSCGCYMREVFSATQINIGKARRLVRCLERERLTSDLLKSRSQQLGR